MKFFILFFLLLLFYIPSKAQFTTSMASNFLKISDDDQANSFLMKGWLKFFTYTPSIYSSIVPDKFEYNPIYSAQFSYGRNPTFTDKDKDQYGWFNIKDDTHFFFILTKTTLFSVYARRVFIEFYLKSMK